MDYEIIHLNPENKQIIHQLAHLLVESFKGISGAWPDMDAALEEVRECLEPGRITRIALAEDGRILGWVGAIREYAGHAWELHPLVVHPDHQGQGIGSALVTDIEQQVRTQGAYTIYLGTDDEDDRTTLSNRDLYPDLLEQIAHIQNPGRHPYEFYQKRGYTIVGVIPDANGPGKPDILMAKRIG